ncbi:MAG: hypothetical protein WCV71_00645 [Patescibacteria group bacterium]
MTRKPVIQTALESLDRQIDDRVVIDIDGDVDEAQHMLYAFRTSVEEVIFEGDNTEECRRQCLANLTKVGYLEEAIKELMTFSKRSRRAVRRWLYGEVVPQRVDWLRWQYWLRAKGYYTRELDHMPNSFFQLRKHILCGDISFAVAAKELGCTQKVLRGILNNEVDRAVIISIIGNVHHLVAKINRQISHREIVGYMEVYLDSDGEFAEVNRRYNLDNQKRRRKVAHKAAKARRKARSSKS